MLHVFKAWGLVFFYVSWRTVFLIGIDMIASSAEQFSLFRPSLDTGH